MARLTSYQATALTHVAEGGAVPGYLIDKTIPSLIKRGLISKESIWLDKRVNFNYRPGSMLGGPAYLPGGYEIKYYLTEEGRDAYIKMRTANYKSQREKLDSEYDADISRAKARTR